MAVEGVPERGPPFSALLVAVGAGTSLAVWLGDRPRSRTAVGGVGIVAHGVGDLVRRLCG